MRRDESMVSLARSDAGASDGGGMRRSASRASIASDISSVGGRDLDLGPPPGCRNPLLLAFLVIAALGGWFIANSVFDLHLTEEKHLHEHDPRHMEQGHHWYDVFHHRHSEHHEEQERLAEEALEQGLIPGEEHDGGGDEEHEEDHEADHHEEEGEGHEEEVHEEGEEHELGGQSTGGEGEQDEVEAHHEEVEVDLSEEHPDELVDHVHHVEDADDNATDAGGGEEGEGGGEEGKVGGEGDGEEGEGGGKEGKVGGEGDGEEGEGGGEEGKVGGEGDGEEGEGGGKEGKVGGEGDGEEGEGGGEEGKVGGEGDGEEGEGGGKEGKVGGEGDGEEGEGGGEGESAGGDDANGGEAGGARETGGVEDEGEQPQEEEGQEEKGESEDYTADAIRLVEELLARSGEGVPSPPPPCAPATESHAFLSRMGSWFSGRSRASSLPPCPSPPSDGDGVAGDDGAAAGGGGEPTAAPKPAKPPSLRRPGEKKSSPAPSLVRNASATFLPNGGGGGFELGSRVCSTLSKDPEPKGPALRTRHKCDCGENRTCESHDKPALSYILEGFTTAAEVKVVLDAVPRTQSSEIIVHNAGFDVDEYLEAVEVPWGRVDKMQGGYIAEGLVAGQYMERDFMVSAWGGGRKGSLHDALVRFASGKHVSIVKPSMVNVDQQKFSAGKPKPRSSLIKQQPGHSCAGDTNTVSFVVQYFRRPAGIPALATRFASLPVKSGEFLVNNDGYQDYHAWANYLAKVPKINPKMHAVLVMSGNIHEIRAYNRLAKLARGEMLVLLQDDDLPTQRVGFLSHVQSLFSHNPKLLVVSGLSATIEGGMFTGKYSTRRGRRPIPPRFKDSTGRNFIFGSMVNFGPFSMRRSVFLELGSFHQSYSCRGEPGIQFDYEFSLRAWYNGWQAGVINYRLNYQQSGRHSGTRSNKMVYNKRKRIDVRNVKYYMQQYSGFYKIQGNWHSGAHHGAPIGVHKLAGDANRDLLRNKNKYR